MFKYVLYFTFASISVFCTTYSSLCDNAESDDVKSEEKFIDITRDISSVSPCVPKQHTVEIYDLEIEKSNLLDANCYPHMISTPSFAGTCITAPSFRDGNWKTVGNIPLKDLVMVPAVKIDVSKFATAKTKITAESIKTFEREFGNIPSKSFVIIYTGWSQYWTAEGKKYTKNYPELTTDAADYLIKRGVLGVGMDTPVPDKKSTNFEVQEMLYANGMYVVKNLSDETSQVQATSGHVIILPLKFENSNESPCRVIYVKADKKSASIISNVMQSINGFLEKWK